MANVLAVALIVLGVVAGMLGVAIYGVSKSAVHEIEALMCFVCAIGGVGLGAVVLAVSCVGGAIETELRAIHRLLAERR